MREVSGSRFFLAGCFISSVTWLAFLGLLIVADIISVGNEDAPEANLVIAEAMSSAKQTPIGSSEIPIDSENDQTSASVTMEEVTQADTLTPTALEPTVTNTSVPATPTPVPQQVGATIVVNTLDDAPRGCPDNCTLRSAIMSAQSGDVIVFADGLAGTILWLQPLTIDKDLTITGPDAESLIIDGAGQIQLLIISQNVTVEISGITFQNASGRDGGGISNSGTLTISSSTLSGNSASGEGGGIYNGGTLTINNSFLSGNSAPRGSGIFNDRGTVTINNSLLYSNSGGGGFNSSGGGSGIYNGGTVTISSSTLSGNSADDNGGGIYNVGTLTISSSTLSDNSADSGGGIVNGGTLTISSSTLSGNSASGEGGGIVNGGTLTINASTLSGNSADWSGGGIDNYYGTLTISNSTLSGNSAPSGGGIDNSYGTLTISSSTLSGNSANSAGGGIYNSGTVTISSSTLSGNSADDNGGGIYNGSGQENVTLLSTLIAGNEASEGADVFGTVTSLGNNLIGNPEGSAGWFSIDLQNVDPMLEPLADNGGSTQTMALLEGSPAVGAGFCEGDAANGIPPVTTDQRGAPRKSPCDIGAYESGVDVPDNGE